MFLIHFLSFFYCWFSKYILSILYSFADQFKIKIKENSEIFEICNIKKEFYWPMTLRNIEKQKLYYKLVFFLLLLLFLFLFSFFFCFLFQQHPNLKYKIKKKYLYKKLLLEICELFLCKIWRTERTRTHMCKRNIKMCKTQALLKDICNTIKNQVSLPKRLSAKLQEFLDANELCTCLELSCIFSCDVG